MTHKMMISVALAAVLSTGLATTASFARDGGFPYERFSAVPSCDPNGPRGAFAFGIPAVDNPVWCETTRPGFAVSTTPAPEQPTRARRLRHR